MCVCVSVQMWKQMWISENKWADQQQTFIVSISTHSVKSTWNVISGGDLITKGTGIMLFSCGWIA